MEPFPKRQRLSHSIPNSHFQSFPDGLDYQGSILRARHALEDGQDNTEEIYNEEDEEDAEDEDDGDEEALDPDFELEQQRAKLDYKLKSRFESIFEKYGRDFSGVGDEIDLRTGKIIVDNGHLVEMQDEGDIGTKRKASHGFRLTFNDEEDEEEDDEEDEDEDEDDEEDSGDDREQEDDRTGNTEGDTDNVYHGTSEDDREPDAVGDSDAMDAQTDNCDDLLPRAPRQGAFPSVPVALPSEDDIMAQFGPELGPQIIKYVGQQRALDNSKLEPAWRTPGLPVPQPGKRPILKSILLQPQKERSPSPGRSTSVWGTRKRKHRNGQHDRLRYPFTDVDRQLVLEWISWIQEQGRAMWGNHWNELAKKVPHHTAHSWSQYYRNKLFPLGLNEKPVHDNSTDESITRPVIKSYTAPGNAQPKMSIVFLRKKKVPYSSNTGRAYFTDEDDIHVVEWVLECCKKGLNPGSKRVWENFADVRPKHSGTSYLYRYKSMRQSGQLRIVSDDNVSSIVEGLQEPTSAESSRLITPTCVVTELRSPDEVTREMPSALIDSISRVLEQNMSNTANSQASATTHHRTQAWSKEEDNIIANAIENATETGLPFDRGTLWRDMEDLLPGRTEKSFGFRLKTLRLLGGFDHISCNRKGQVDDIQRTLPPMRAAAQQRLPSLDPLERYQSTARRQEELDPSLLPKSRSVRVRQAPKRDPGTVSWSEVMETVENIDPILHAGLMEDMRRAALAGPATPNQGNNNRVRNPRARSSSGFDSSPFHTDFSPLGNNSVSSQSFHPETSVPFQATHRRPKTFNLPSPTTNSAVPDIRPPDSAEASPQNKSGFRSHNRKTHAQTHPVLPSSIPDSEMSDLSSPEPTPRREAVVEDDQSWVLPRYDNASIPEDEEANSSSSLSNLRNASEPQHAPFSAKTNLTIPSISDAESSTTDDADIPARNPTTSSPLQRSVSSSSGHWDEPTAWAELRLSTSSPSVSEGSKQELLIAKGHDLLKTISAIPASFPLPVDNIKANLSPSKDHQLPAGSSHTPGNSVKFLKPSEKIATKTRQPASSGLNHAELRPQSSPSGSSNLKPSRPLSTANPSSPAPQTPRRRRPAVPTHIETDDDEDELSIISSTSHPPLFSTPGSNRTLTIKSEIKTTTGPLKRLFSNGIKTSSPSSRVGSPATRISSPTLKGSPSAKRRGRASNVSTLRFSSSAAEVLDQGTEVREEIDEAVMETPGGTRAACGENGFQCGRDFCLTCE